MSLPISPSLAGFRDLATQGRVIPVYARLRADGLTPVGLYRHLCGDREGTFLLESAESGVFARYSFIGVNSLATLSEEAGRAVWSGHEIVGLPAGGDPLEVLAETLRVLHTPADAALPPLTSGMVGYLGYDVVRRLETIPDDNPDVLGIPELLLFLVGEMAVLDHQTGELWLIANAVNFDNSPARLDEAYADAAARVRALAARLAEPVAPLLHEIGPPADQKLVRSRTPAEFEAGVRSAVEEIKAGEAFQIVLSQRFALPTTADPFDVYRVLRHTNPSPYLYLLRLPGFAVVGSSPEALVTVKGTTAVTHPIAGTKPRGATAIEDQANEAALLGDEKERAEHLMLVDLGRNDLGRVCRPGTVRVLEFMQVHRYSHVMHLEATVTGELLPGRTALAATLACFPAGTLSGAPKVRAMEIIDRLEDSRRGLYGGVVGYFDFAGNADAAIAIRTAVMKDGVAYVQAGAGVVADSVPASEEAETQNKAAAVLQAVRSAEGLRGL